MVISLSSGLLKLTPAALLGQGRCTSTVAALSVSSGMAFLAVAREMFFFVANTLLDLQRLFGLVQFVLPRLVGLVHSERRHIGQLIFMASFLALALNSLSALASVSSTRNMGSSVENYQRSA